MNRRWNSMVVRSAFVGLLGMTMAARPAVAQDTTRNTAAIPALSPGFQQRHTQFLEVAKQGNIDLLLMGDSITDWWRNRGIDAFNANFAGIACANFGIAGDRTQGVLWRMENGELEGYTPKLMMLMIGTNNLGGGRGGAGNTPAQIAEAITLIVNKFKTKFPTAKVLLLGVFPRGAMASAPQREPIKQINAIIAKLDDGGKTVRYMDIGDKFLEPDGSIAVSTMADGLHPTAEGYTKWAAAVMPTIKEMLKK
jgi:lysophospholipase L1-like esterase